MIRIQRLMKLHRLMGPAGEGGSDTGGTGTGEGDKSGEGEGAKKDGDEGGEKDKTGDGAKPDGDKTAQDGKDSTAKMSDADAKLLKDVMKQKERATALQAELEAAKAALAAFDGVDPKRARELIAQQEEAERKAMEARGEYDRLTAQMAERHQEELGRANAQMSTISSENQALKQQIAELTVGQAFAGSTFVASDLTLTATKARVIYGAHFEFKDGKVVGYDKPAGASDRTVLVSSVGEPLSFDEALRVLVDKDPDRDQLIRSKAKPGAGSSTTSKGAKAAVSAAEAAKTSKLSGAEKIAAGLKALAKQN